MIFNNRGEQITPSRHIIKMELLHSAKRSETDPSRYIVMIDDKPLEIITKSLEFVVGSTGDVIQDVIDAVSRLRGTEEIKSITIRCE